MPLYELAYVSKAQPGLSQGDLDEIVSQSQLNNALKDISGILLFNGTSFAQILEGAQDEVAAIFNSIAADRRHTNVVKIAAGPVAARSFAGWSMKLVKDDLGIFGQDSEVLNALATHGGADHAELTGPFLKAVKEIVSNQVKNPQA